ncbi:MAG: AMP-binding protein [Planctomycetota bacterium]
MRGERLIDFVVDHAAQMGDKPAQHFRHRGDWRSLSWRQVLGWVSRVADRLPPPQHSQHLPTRIITRIGDGAAAIVAALAVQMHGSLEVALGDCSDELMSVWMHRTNACCCLSAEQVWSALDSSLDSSHPIVHTEGPLETDLSAAASLMLLTSGTSGSGGSDALGSRRGIVLSHAGLVANAFGKLSAVPQTSNDIRLSVLPLHHAFARTCDFGTWVVTGGELICANDRLETTQALLRFRPTLMNLVPRLAMHWLREIDTSGSLQAVGMQRLRCVGVGGAAIDADAFCDFGRWGLTVIQGYGLTEAGPCVCSATLENASQGYVGFPVAGCQVRLDDAGQLMVRGDSLMLGEWDAGSQAIDNRRVTPRGWLSSGDLAEFDDERGFKVLGRMDDRIVLPTGISFHAVGLESILAATAAIQHAVVFADGHRVGVVVNLSADVDRIEDSWPGLKRVIRESIERWSDGDLKCGEIVFSDQPFTTSNGFVTGKGTVCRNAVLQYFNRPPTKHSSADVESASAE